MKSAPASTNFPARWIACRSNPRRPGRCQGRQPQTVSPQRRRRRGELGDFRGLRLHRSVRRREACPRHRANVRLGEQYHLRPVRIAHSLAPSAAKFRPGREAISRGFVSENPDLQSAPVRQYQPRRQPEPLVYARSPTARRHFDEQYFLNWLAGRGWFPTPACGRSIPSGA